MKYHNKKGAAILLTILILTAILAIAFGVCNLMIGEIKMSREAPKSLIAYCAAEAGIEKKLYEVRDETPNYDKIGNGPNCSDGDDVQLNSDTFYAVDVISSGPTCVAESYCLKSYGCYKGTRRAIEVSY